MSGLELQRKLTESGHRLPVIFVSVYGNGPEEEQAMQFGASIFAQARQRTRFNQCNRDIRPTALGKKNWLFFGDADAGQYSAILYTVIESCRCRGIDPHAYLRDVLTRLPSMTNWQVKSVTPEAWTKNFTLLRNGHRRIARTITVRVEPLTLTVEISELCQ